MPNVQESLLTYAEGITACNTVLDDLCYRIAEKARGKYA